MTAPRVFVSYSHDAEAHKAWVLRLASDLRGSGVDASLDRWDLQAGQDVAAFMQRAISDSERVILICSDEYVAKADAGTGGVGYERLIVSAEVVRNIDTRKFVPVVRNNATRKLPAFLGERLFVDFNDDEQYGVKLDELLRELLGAPAAVRPPLGVNPFSGELPSVGGPVRTTGTSGIVSGGGRVLDDSWFSEQATISEKGIGETGLVGRMELRFALHEEIAKSQLELLNAVRKAQIHTFGWPIGITLESREEYRPRPFNDGIRAEVAIDGGGFTDRQSYDYWALRSNGDFYLLQSLFEDQRGSGKVFFNTRIVRVTEALLFAAKLYEDLSVSAEAVASLRVSHRGLSGRELTSSNPNRSIFPATAMEDVVAAEIVETVGSMRDNLVDNVQKMVEPMFMLFDFKEFSPQVYREIIENFAAGNVT